jgi:hypothetical protein
MSPFKANNLREVEKLPSAESWMAHLQANRWDEDSQIALRMATLQTPFGEAARKPEDLYRKVLAFVGMRAARATADDGRSPTTTLRRLRSYLENTNQEAIDQPQRADYKPRHLQALINSVASFLGEDSYRISMSDLLEILNK